MSKLYYGSGEVNIEGTEIRGVEISYRGAIEITKTAGDNFELIANDKKIMIFPIGEGYLNNLFTYTGELKIISIVVVNNDEIIPATINKLMDLPEVMGKSEDLTIKSEKMNAGYIYKGRVGKTRVLNNYIKNQHSNGELFLSDKSPYSGAYHIHLDTEKAMTGVEHTELSEDLYINVRNKMVKTGHKEKVGTKIRPGIRTTGTTSGGTGGGGY